MSSQRIPVSDRTRFLERREFSLVRIVALLGLVVLWELLTRIGWIPPLFLPSPLGVLASGVQMAVSGELLDHLTASLQRIIAATFPIPKIALLPLLILWLGIGEASKVAVIALGVFFPMAINTFTGVRTADRDRGALLPWRLGPLVPGAPRAPRHPLEVLGRRRNEAIARAAPRRVPRALVRSCGDRLGEKGRDRGAQAYLLGGHLPRRGEGLLQGVRGRAELVFFQAGQPVAVALASGDIDVGATGLTAGLYNTVAGGVKVWIVADKGREWPGYHLTAILVQPELYDKGLRSLRDLREKTLGITQIGSTFHYSIGNILEKEGLALSDVELVPRRRSGRSGEPPRAGV